MTVDRPLSGRAALVTGASRNIGRAIALHLAAQGASVLVHAGSDAGAAEAVAGEVRGLGGRAEVRVADLRDPAQASGLVEIAAAAFGRLDIVVNNAAVRRETPLASLPFQEWRDVLAIILDAAFVISQAAAPHLAEGGMGSIVNIGGVSANLGAARRAHVVTAKAGLSGLTRALAHDLAPQGITANCVVPGMIDTSRDANSPEPSHVKGKMPLAGRLGSPDDVAAMVAFLCGPQARYVTGQTIQASGGLHLSP